ncbi:MAG: hypothetical protein IKG58_03375 [Bacilli bacterium]|nr:hypothetical protein [Bacilli bacterium]MBR3049579.1 hypothetical protein [Bacilli bacterium]
MKKIGFILSISVFILILTGCNGTVTKDLRHAGYNLSQTKLTCSDLIPKNEKEEAPKQISYMNGDMAITTDGEIYEMTFDKAYSNDENCRKASTDIIVTATMDNKILKGDDGELYYAVGSNETEAYRQVTSEDNSYELYKMLLTSDEVVKVISDGENTYYILLKDGNVYKFIIQKPDRDQPYSVMSKVIVYSEEKYGKIIDFNIDMNNNEKTYIKTKNKIYRMQASNEKKCSKYADVECNYEMKPDKVVNKYYKDKIVYYGPDIIITNYGKIFN